MRRYTLASPESRKNVDLRDYKEVIEKAVHGVMPKATVRVEKDAYYVHPTPIQADAVKIGRQICKSAISEHCVFIPKLFSSNEVKESEDDRKKQQCLGGHF